MKNNYSYFQNKECEFFPCHKTEDEFFNCLFCYCPLYSLGDGCGGEFTFTADGIKDCSACLIPHGKDGYSHVMSRCPEVLDKCKQQTTGGISNERN